MAIASSAGAAAAAGGQNVPSASDGIAPGAAGTRYASADSVAGPSAPAVASATLAACGLGLAGAYGIVRFRAQAPKPGTAAPAAAARDVAAATETATAAGSHVRSAEETRPPSAESPCGKAWDVRPFPELRPDDPTKILREQQIGPHAIVAYALPPANPADETVPRYHERQVDMLCAKHSINMQTNGRYLLSAVRYRRYLRDLRGAGGRTEDPASAQEAVAIYNRFRTDEGFGNEFPAYESLIGAYRSSAAHSAGDAALSRLLTRVRCFFFQGCPAPGISEAQTQTTLRNTHFVTVAFAQGAWRIYDPLAPEPFPISSAAGRKIETAHDALVAVIEREHVRSPAGADGERLPLTYEIGVPLVASDDELGSASLPRRSSARAFDRPRIRRTSSRATI